tara:strand:+ start:230 stop:799 length:570 start_codon:yes stop_codon:yes gene_type:complete
MTDTDTLAKAEAIIAKDALKKAKDKQWKLDNAEAVSASKKIYYQENKEKIAAQRLVNKDKLAEANREYNAKPENKAKRKEYLAATADHNSARAKEYFNKNKDLINEKRKTRYAAKKLEEQQAKNTIAELQNELAQVHLQDKINIKQKDYDSATCGSFQLDKEQEEDNAILLKELEDEEIQLEFLKNVNL